MSPISIEKVEKGPFDLAVKDPADGFDEIRNGGLGLEKKNFRVHDSPP